MKLRGKETEKDGKGDTVEGMRREYDRRMRQRERRQKSIG
jgi:hypothetical protein